MNLFMFKEYLFRFPLFYYENNMLSIYHIYRLKCVHYIENVGTAKSLFAMNMIVAIN